MSNSLVIPSIKKEWQVPSNQPSWRTQAISMLSKVKGNYLKEFQNASNLTGVPLDILIGFATVESGGARNETLDGASKGIMQVNTDTAYQALLDQMKNGVSLGSFYPYYVGCPSIFNVKKPIAKDFWGSQNAKERQQNVNDWLSLKPISPIVLSDIRKCILKDAQWSIYIGSLILSQLIYGTIKKTGQIRLDHIIIKYNAGTGRFRSLVTKKGLESSKYDTTEIYKAVPIPVTQAYIVKLLGINGFLDLLSNQKAV
jgi:hypothetical protein